MRAATDLDGLIRICLQHLRLSLTDAKDWNTFRRTLHAYARVAKKLEAGWPGFSGEIVSISGKKHRRRTEWDVLEQEYVMWSIFPNCFNPDVWSEVYTAFAPAPDHHYLRDAWLLGAISEPSYDQATFLRLAADAAASEPGTDAHGNLFQQIQQIQHLHQVQLRHLRFLRGYKSLALFFALYRLYKKKNLQIYFVSYSPCRSFCFQKLFFSSLDFLCIDEI